MRFLRLTVPVLAIALVVAGLVIAVPSSGDTPDYYVALGDSLSQGYQPGLGDTNQGYVDDLYATLRAQDPNLALVKLGCSGETTTTMINGGICSYSAGSQLNAAVAFLQANSAKVKYLTLDIGANDVDGCASGGSIDPVCVASGLQTIGKNLVTILGALDSADGRKPLAVGMTYYDPFLAEWRTGLTGQVVATASVPLANSLDTELAAEFTLYGLRTADVGSAFKTDAFVPQVSTSYGTLPTNVAYICNYTYMCSPSNIHANPPGYQLIANVFAKSISG